MTMRRKNNEKRRYGAIGTLRPLALASTCLLAIGCNEGRSGTGANGDAGVPSDVSSLPDGHTADAVGGDAVGDSGTSDSGTSDAGSTDTTSPPPAIVPRPDPNYIDAPDIEDFHPALEELPHGMTDGESPWCVPGADPRKGIAVWADITGLYAGVLAAEEPESGSGVYRYDGVGWDWLVTGPDVGNTFSAGDRLTLTADEYWLAGRSASRPSPFAADWDGNGSVIPTADGFAQTVPLVPFLLHRDDGPWRPWPGAPIPAEQGEFGSIPVAWVRDGVAALARGTDVIVQRDGGEWNHVVPEAGAESEAWALGSIGDTLFVHYSYGNLDGTWGQANGLFRRKTSGSASTLNHFRVSKALANTRWCA